VAAGAVGIPKMISHIDLVAPTSMRAEITFGFLLA